MAYDIFRKKQTSRDWSIAIDQHDELELWEVGIAAGGLLALAAVNTLKGDVGVGFGLGLGTGLLACGAGMHLLSKFNKTFIAEWEASHDLNAEDDRPSLTLVP